MGGFNPDDPRYYTLMFDPSTMKDEAFEDEGQSPELLRRQRVEIIISPALFKRGNSDGERFELEYPAAKAWVLMEPTP